MTGLTDKMRCDFKMMKDLSVHTKLNPQDREERLKRFVTKIQRWVIYVEEVMFQMSSVEGRLRTVWIELNVEPSAAPSGLSQQ